MSIDDVVTTGLVALFGGTLVWAAIGAIVGRFKGFQVGLAVGMMLFGLTGLSVAAWLAWLLWGTGGAAPSREQIGLVGVFGAFGGFGLLGGGVILASELETRRPHVARPVAAWRARLATGFTVSGHLSAWGSLLGAGFLDVSAERGTLIAFEGVALGCGCWWLATLAGGRASIAATLFFALLGGGFYLAAASLRLFGS